MTGQRAKAELFRAKHRPGAGFVRANVWDAGSARLMAGLGFEALGTTSAGFAFARGDADRVGVTPREAVLAHCREIVAATDLPVSADLEDGFGADPAMVAQTVRLAAETGLVGCTIEDVTDDPAAPIHDFNLAVARIEAAVAAARSLDFPFTLTARAENFLHGRPDLDDTIGRLKAFEAAGAHVLYAPGLPDMAAIRAVCAAVSAPVNVVVGIRPVGLTVAALRGAGVARISLGSSLARTALGAAIDAARAILEDGSFAGVERGAAFGEIARLLEAGAGK